MVYRLRTVLIYFCFSVCSSFAFAAQDKVPRSINFQGFLTDSTGVPINVTTPMRFGLYTNSTRIWYAMYGSVVVSKGFFAVSLGQSAQGGAPLDPTTGAGGQPASVLPIYSSLLSGVDWSTSVSIEVEIYNGANFDVLSPRFQMNSTLFALKADSIDGYDSTQLAKLDASGNIISNNSIPVIDPDGNWIGPGGVGGTGATGAAGLPGAIGPTGAMGPTGPAGADGAFGVTGATGATGANGANGTNGTNGTNGANGSTGPMGSAGTDGAAGVTGMTGVSGATGATGANGLNGSAGATGSTGAAGSNGAIGATGATGGNGANGTNGTNGANGATGMTGANGLNGSAGATGATGAAGSNGAVGATGASGKTGATGPTGPGYYAMQWFFPGQVSSGVQTVRAQVPMGVAGCSIINSQITVNTASGSASTYNIQRCTAAGPSCSSTANIYSADVSLGAGSESVSGGAPNTATINAGDVFRVNLVTVGASLADVSIAMTYSCTN